MQLPWPRADKGAGRPHRQWGKPAADGDTAHNGSCPIFRPMRPAASLAYAPLASPCRPPCAQLADA
jgi:hypothetical protein